MKLRTLRYLVPALALSLAFAEEAPKISISGSIDAIVSGEMDRDTKEITYSNFHEIDMTIAGQLNKKASVEVYMTSMADGSPESVVNEDSTGMTSGRWPSISFDGVVGIYEFDMGLKLLVGDLVATEGGFSYYAYSHTSSHASAFAEQFIRGLGVEVKGLTLYAGSQDIEKTSALYLNYALAAGPATIKPFFFINTATTDFKTSNIKAGLDLGLSLGDQSASFIYAVLKDDNCDPTHTMKLEASLASGPMSLAFTGFVAITQGSGDKLTAYDVEDDEAFVYVEPGYDFNDLVTLGIPLELHANKETVDDTDFQFWPTLYLNPADNMTFLFWGGLGIPLNDDLEIYNGFGAELLASF